jgi:hypothetical protein
MRAQKGGARSNPDLYETVASRRVVGIEPSILGGDQSEGVSSLMDAWSLSTTR